MGIQERRERERQQRRKNIMKQTRDLIVKQGAESVSMQDIADAAELSKAALYLYFRNKEAIMREIMLEAAQGFSSYVETRIAAVEGGLQKLLTLGQSYLGFHKDHYRMFCLAGIRINFSSDEAMTGPKAAPSATSQTTESFRDLILQRFEPLILGIIRTGMADGSFSPRLQVEKTTRTLLLVCIAALERLTEVNATRGQSPDHVAREIMDIFTLLVAALTNKEFDPASLDLAMTPPESGAPYNQKETS